MFLFCLVFAMSLCASVYMCFVVTCWEGLTSWLSFVVSNCEFVTFPFVSWVRCDTRLYRFLIFAPLLTFRVIGFCYLIDCCSNIIYYFDIKFKACFADILMFIFDKSQLN